MWMQKKNARDIHEIVVMGSRRTDMINDKSKFYLAQTDIEEPPGI
jgi:hypothetical protein